MMAPLTDAELDLMRKAGSIVRECLNELSKSLKEGISTKDLEKIADECIRSRNARAAFRGYKGYPASICTSRNEVVVHGIPSENELLKAGDILSVDVGVEYKGIYADAAETFAIGEVSKEAERLMAVTKEALKRGIEQAKAGNHIQDISWAIQSFVESNGYNVVRVFVGHGIGRSIHEEPEVPNFGKPNKGGILKKGMAIAIEPMVNQGTGTVSILDDNWTAVTKDGKLSAHFEHTVIVDEDKAEIVT